MTHQRRACDPREGQPANQILHLQGLYGIFVELFASGWYCTHADYGGCEQAGDSFSYFTVLTYWGLAFYNLTAAVHTLTYARTGTPLLDRFPRALQALHAFYYTTVTTYPFIVTAVYWGVIFPGVWFTDEYSGWSNVSQHALNSVFALFEIVVPRTPLPPWIHALWLIVVLALYLALAYVTHATKGFYTYTFLDIEKQGSAITAAWIIAIAVAAVVIYLLVRGLLWLRLWLTEKKAGMDGRFAGQPAALRSTADVELGSYRNEETKAISPHHY